MAQSTLSVSAGDTLESLKTPPHSIEAEQSVLGGLMLDNQAWDKIADIITDEDFYRHDHRLVYSHICKLIEHNKPADVVTVAESLESSAELQNVGGLAYIGSIVQNTPTAANIKRYAEIVRERSIMRSLAQVGVQITESAFSPAGRSAADLLDEAESRVFEIAEEGARGKQGFVDIQPLLKEVVERIELLYSRDNPSEVTGIASGFHDLDQKTSGFQPGDLIIVAGRPSMGKTAFSLNIAEHVALELNKPVAVFSMEMGGAQLAMRMLGSVGRLDQHKVRTGRLDDDDWPKLTHALGKLNDAPVYIDESAALSALKFVPEPGAFTDSMMDWV